MNGSGNVNFFFPAPWGPGEGSKGQISFNFNYKVNFKDFYSKLCVFSQMKDTKHIRQDFYSVAWVMPQGWDFGALRMPRGSKNFFKHGHMAYQINGDGKQNRMQVAFSSLGQAGDLGVRSKGQISLTCQFERFLYETLCVCSHK